VKSEAIKEVQVTPEELDKILKTVDRRQMPMCQKDKLAICGTADTLKAAPFGNKDFEIWAVAQCTTYPVFKRADLLFEMHTEGYWSDPPVLERINASNLPIVMHEQDKRVEQSIRYPIEEISKYRKYHTTSITYMLAWAYHSFVKTGKPKNVAMFGVHMEAREEYTEQRPCCEYWLGRMEGAGQSVAMNGGALLVSSGLYGYENYDPIAWKIRQRIAGLQLGQKERARQELAAQLQKHEQIGAQKEAEYWLRLAQRGELLNKEST